VRQLPDLVPVGRTLLLLIAALLAPSLVPDAWAQAPSPAPAPAGRRSRVAIHEFLLDGQDATPALQIQLQDGFIAGLSRAGIPVLETADVSRRLQASPELEKCETALCLKRLGEVLGVHYIMRVRVNVAGNSYRMTARLLSTEGDPPTVVPRATRSRSCDVCTVAEAREAMLRLADEMKPPLEEAPTVTLQAAAPAPRRSWRPYAALGAGIATVMVGVATIYAASSPGSRGTPALGGALMGAGTVVGAVSAYVIVLDQPPARQSVALGLSLRF
jgi:hypothetical protein